jgi:hypothetical protein
MGVYADEMKAGRSKFRLAALFALLAISCFLAIAAFTIAWGFDYLGWHSRAKWLLSASEYKTKVTSEPIGQDNSLRHLEWDGWGFAGKETVVYLVFDPKDQLLHASSTGTSGKYPGIPCEVYRVRRLEKDWYVVEFYTEQGWDNCT